ncbi:ATP-binding cassette domain-containing protein [Millisia brevis]|uniref:ATP-binding cassette domain-containing protein n=1 Tax=Millisia brevis TaxID=264148 RepID=UPI001FDF57A3|nr:ATP-binding cassette domain-containing protein [Millisia brevis]
MKGRTARPAADRTAARRITGPLSPTEMATCATLGTTVVALTVIASVIPALTAAQVLAAAPFALIAQRYRARAVTTSAVATTVVAFAVAGWTSATAVISCALVGGVVGTVHRRGGGLLMVLASALLVGLASSAVGVILLWILRPLRELVLLVMRSSLEGTTRSMEWAARNAGSPDAVAGAATVLRGLGDVVTRQWAPLLLISGTFSMLLTAIVAWWLLRGMLGRLAGLSEHDPLDALSNTAPPAHPGQPHPADPARVAEAQPLPVVFDHVSYRYPGVDRIALNDLSMRIDPAEFVAVTGANGSGKSTLARLLAGMEPTSGRVTRPGRAGLGAAAGTAMVMQSPDSQILSTRVADEVVWGLPADSVPEPEQVERLLEVVGLGGLGDQHPNALSGGQQQRLVVAAALARSPRLLIADEATAMIDPAGRADLVEVFGRLPARGTAVVTITHRREEAEAAQRRIHLEPAVPVRSRPTAGFAPPPGRGAPGPFGPGGPGLRGGVGRQVGQGGQGGYRPTPGNPVLVLQHVGHRYAAGTPWEHRALTDINLVVRRGEAILITGENGSGKSTLTWILAGLITPTEGTCTLNSEPVHKNLGSVALAFQNARLQVVRPTVCEDIEAAGGEEMTTGKVSAALDAVGLDRVLAASPITRLSGGQLRRVALAGLLARNPEVLVLDEPLAGLDPGARAEVTALLGELRQRGTTLVIVSHDTDELRSIVDCRVALRDGMVHYLDDTAPGARTDTAPAAHHGSSPQAHHGTAPQAQGTTREPRR